MSAVSFFQITLAVSVVLAAFALLAATFGGRFRIVGAVLSALIGLAAVSAWVAFALDRDESLGLSAGGITAAAIAAIATLLAMSALRRTGRIDRELERGRIQLRALIDTEVRERKGELERILARARADSSSQLAEQERSLAETRRHVLAEAEKSVHEQLAQMLADTMRDIDERIAGWRNDLERMESTLSREVDELKRRQRELVHETKARLDTDEERFSTEAESQRGSLARFRAEMTGAIESAASSGQDELEKFANERRRAIQDIAERLGRREQDVTERIEREETEAHRRIQAGVAEIERRQLEQLQRFAERTVSGLTDEHVSQLEDTVRAAREEGARRLARELERSIEAYNRQAQAVLGERTRTLTDEAQKKMEQRLNATLEELRERGEKAWGSIERRAGEFEVELRARLETLAAEAESAREALETKMHELHRRLEELRGGGGLR